MMVDKKRKVPNLRFKGFTNDWVQRNLGDITAWTKGQGLPKEDLNEEKSGLEAVHYADLYKFSPVMHEVIHWTNSDDGRVIPNNSLLFPASDVTPVGLARTSTLKLSGVKAGGDVIIGHLDESIDSSFMSYQINATSKKILPLITGTTVKHVQAKSLATLSVSVTNMAEQTAIAGLFERIDKLIAANQRKLDLLKELKQGYLQKMFPKNGAKVPELRFAGFADDWEQRKLGEIAIRVRGNDGRMNLPTLTISAGNGWMDQRDRFSQNIAGKEQKNYTLLKQGELSYNHGNSKLAQFGAVFELESYNEALVPRVYHSFSVTAGAQPKFIEQMFATHRPDRELRKLVSSGARMDGLLNINYEDFMGIKIWLPSVAEQKAIAGLLVKLDNTIDLQHQKLAKYQSVKKSLLQQMFI
ncbi:restriction endonuclease subunit S [Limosilactobacillus fermentum]|uniref:restriction endonuclease subunit S n=1 Tax=Limosilactobacillus fermentum TaxID=1613 RepID=UPI00240E1C8E|nr:restriction endonuclease subunit S [Limosilactobacillus fermentum]WFA02819.1 restriction endonuclease subunit S [Limosilactobacillus fermentum]